MNQLGGCEVKRDLASSYIMDALVRLESQAEKTASRIEDQLHQVCSPSSPSSDCVEETTSRELPPLFSDMRNRMETIERALKWINNILDRCEV